ncbi:hypothetical protein TNCV_3069611 [Trichonephila clavipes]|nr:hypothetical protein TNCV_3069611 [Trichonephila clavipes]
MNYYNANNEDNINVKNNKGLDQISDSPEADLKRLFNPAMVVEDTVPKQTRPPDMDEVGARVFLSLTPVEGTVGVAMDCLRGKTTWANGARYF